MCSEAAVKAFFRVTDFFTEVITAIWKKCSVSIALIFSWSIQCRITTDPFLVLLHALEMWTWVHKIIFLAKWIDQTFGMVSFYLKNSQPHTQYMWGTHLKWKNNLWSLLLGCYQFWRKITYLGSLGMELPFLAQEKRRTSWVLWSLPFCGRKGKFLVASW